jgi:hypothetical protein
MNIAPLAAYLVLGLLAAERTVAVADAMVAGLNS